MSPSDFPTKPRTKSSGGAIRSREAQSDRCEMTHGSTAAGTSTPPGPQLWNCLRDPKNAMLQSGLRIRFVAVVARRRRFAGNKAHGLGASLESAQETRI